MTSVKAEPTTTGEPAARETFDSLDPATDEVVGTHPVHTADDVATAVERARAASRWWAGLGFAGREERLQRWKGVLTRRAAQLAELVHAETGKPHRRRDAGDRAGHRPHGVGGEARAQGARPEAAGGRAC